MLYKRGMTLVESSVVLAILSIMATGLVSLAIATLSVQQSAKLKNIATRCAETKIEEIKSLEREKRLFIQNGSWSGFTDSDDNCVYNTDPRFFTRATRYTDISNGKQAAVTVSWSEKGRSVNIILTTQITKWN